MSVMIGRVVEPVSEVPELVSDHEEDLIAGRHDAACKLEQCLALLDFSDAQLDAFFNLPPLSADGGATKIPAAYVRDTIPRLKVNPREAWDYLILLKQTNKPESISRAGPKFPMHDVIWNSQCLGKFEKQTSETSSSKYIVIPVHTISGFETLMKWLYRNDEDALYEDLLNGMQKNENYIIDFSTHVRNLGCVNAKITGVIRAIYGDEEDDDEEDEEDETEDEDDDENISSHD